jgi:predicted metal-dependent RNase
MRGRITYDKGRWKQRGGNLYLKIFAQEGLGRPDLEIGGALDSAKKFLEEILPEDSDVPDIQAALIFTNDATEVDVDNAPVPSLHAKKLKDFIRKTAKNKPISMDKVQEIQEAIVE